MPTSVVMPQMGESIAEGTIVRWIKKVGDPVDRDEPLFEISTDKVDAEIPSPVAGVLTEIKVHEGETVAVNSVVAVIGQAGEPLAEAPAPAAAQRLPAEPSAGVAAAAASTQQQPDGQPASTAATEGTARPVPTAPPAVEKPQPPPVRPRTTGDHRAPALTTEERRRLKSSPLVRRIAEEHHVDITQIPGSGIGGRVTKDDILGYLDGIRDPGSGIRQARTPTPPAESMVETRGGPEPPGSRIPDPGSRVEVRPLSLIRKKIAEHMVLSRRTSAHVHSVFHVDFSTIEKLRQQKKAEYERMGARLTYMAFIAKAVVDAIRRHPIINASIDGNNVVYKKDLNLGIAVALDEGLIVPVIKNADEKNLLGLSRAIADVAERARSKQLHPDEVHGGTFTITNPGQFGAQFGLPIINQPQVAILAVGAVEKRPVVVDDAIGIRTMAYLALGFDHRLIDGAVADAFMGDLKHQLENFDANQV